MPIPSCQLCQPKKQAHTSKAEMRHEEGWIEVTQQLWVKHVINLTEVPTVWPVPKEGEPTAYIIDLTNSPFKYLDSKGKPFAMSTNIKNKVCLNNPLIIMVNTDPIIVSVC